MRERGPGGHKGGEEVSVGGYPQNEHAVDRVEQQQRVADGGERERDVARGDGPEQQQNLFMGQK